MALPPYTFNHDTLMSALGFVLDLDNQGAVPMEFIDPAVLPIMEEQGSGQNIFVSSVAGHVVNPVGAVYSAVKTEVRVIAEALRQEVKDWGGRTTVVSPGPCSSPSASLRTWASTRSSTARPRRPCDRRR